MHLQPSKRNAIFVRESILIASFPPDMHGEASALFCLICGFIPFFLGVQSILSGRTWERYHGWVYRTKKPGAFWWNVACLFVLALFLIGRALYLVSGR